MGSLHGHLAGQHQKMRVACGTGVGDEGGKECAKGQGTNYGDHLCEGWSQAGWVCVYACV